MRDKIVFIEAIATGPVRVVENLKINDAYSNQEIYRPSSCGSVFESYSENEYNKFMGNSYLLQGITPELAKKLLNREAYLIFEVEAVDHNRRTANGRLYPEKIFRQALQDPSFQRLLTQLGGAPGTAEHPMMKMVGNDPAATKFNNSIRTIAQPIDTRTHRVIGYRTENGKTYFTIKTGFENLAIVEALLNGCNIGFSIRCTGETDENNIAIVLKILGIDYVANPANGGSTLSIGDKIRMVDITGMSDDVTLTFTQRPSGGVLQESVGDVIGMKLENGDKIYTDLSNPTDLTFRIKSKKKVITNPDDLLRSIKRNIY